MSRFGFQTLIRGDLPSCVEKVKVALAGQGFGVLTTIDVATTLKNKINVDFRPYQILGACNPKFAHKALSMDEDVGLFLPCNVVVEQKDSKVEACTVTIIDPGKMFELINNPALSELSKEAHDALEKVIEVLKAGESKV